MSLNKLDHSNPQECLRNPLNNSTSKMQYSFSKSNRFNKSLRKYIMRQQSVVPYYDLPNELDKRTTGFGYGNKTTFEDRRIVPPPGSYKPPSDFDNHNHGVTFGFSRQRVKNASMFMKSDVPGPGTYNPKQVKHDLSFKLKSRVRDNSQDEQIKVPGPGHYALSDLINKLGRYPTSKYENSRCPIISKSIFRIKTEETPAPNTYLPIMLNSRCEKSMLQTPVSKFSLSKRQGIFETSPNPGPGQQQNMIQSSKQFSEFLK